MRKFVGVLLVVDLNVLLTPRQRGFALDVKVHVIEQLLPAVHRAHVQATRTVRDGAAEAGHRHVHATLHDVHALVRKEREGKGLRVLHKCVPRTIEVKLLEEPFEIRLRRRAGHQHGFVVEPIPVVTVVREDIRPFLLLHLADEGHRGKDVCVVADAKDFVVFFTSEELKIPHLIVAPLDRGELSNMVPGAVIGVNIRLMILHNIFLVTGGHLGFIRLMEFDVPDVASVGFKG
mmetsp:Transcript_7425/g.14523  ORF Transcript_7425/g.14523 Transcript_7425/m.14523 type:complete len:233 (-) Transcript_7425:433-1131(-)